MSVPQQELALGPGLVREPGLGLVRELERVLAPVENTLKLGVTPLI